MKTYTHNVDCLPLMLSKVKLKDRVLLDPGGPVIIKGVLVQQHAMIQNIFSSRTLVLATPGGIHSLLP